MLRYMGTCNTIAFLMKPVNAPRKVLAIETSCDETSVALVEKRRDHLVVRAQVIASQIPLHAKTGGVVPEVAARAHEHKIIPLVAKTLAKAAVLPKDISAIAVTQGPGLLTSLLVGATAAKTLAAVWQKPLIPVHHLLGHTAAAWLGRDFRSFSYPMVILIVSGGHTELWTSSKLGAWRFLGRTRDDAAGEAFDKTAKMLGLGYPGGPAISRMAEHGNAQKFPLPRPLAASSDYDFSFSGLKTSVKYLHEAQTPRVKKSPVYVRDLAASIERAIVDALVGKCLKAIAHIQPKTLILAGGVAANTLLRKTLAQHAADKGINFAVPDKTYCTDNAAMIGAAALLFPRVVPRNWQASSRLKIV
ncbi:MAG: tRNA (adenosine(37)-N6)-threonylcarbamoyltransferase complex transferase subunit TsaD [Parcubacteria group bacterium CG08_land_8_20_14_0_20_48_21]|nr:MAG: tRNA (adenosine(37)-N6)-threonylcarbamoyltransferase complex transferase subunit TsaD [Parcubacteria group bacterium CG08_land_8_20_14_0_20_48_21]PIW79512.1 MAG: tRNA (adenosine(37)-N6)-threonylcarbamoyltransferase complex transferase subunit TsaD [Parcubacteria group bacterium CG_4_8_14_3_um_filter_48_16]PIY78142.1 MAG: tRNA (adenosine(37)-N6)-threonylcarbamoyltransferase complex transferase subunit TsaD [Parcubacteria group bacterium CG_4_10_14_0_8_um_filter_48_154]PIZ77082.1 MAG: tRNA